MSGGRGVSILLGTAAALLAAALSSAVARAQASLPRAGGDVDALRVCLLDHDLPRAERSSASGFDVELTKRLAERLGRRHEAVWSRSGSPFTEIEESEIPLEALAEGDCDVVASVPGAAAVEGLEEQIQLSRPYYGAAFELVSPRGRSHTGIDGLVELDGLRDEVVAVRLQTVAHFAVHRSGLRWLSAPTDAEVLELLETGEATAALIWGPAAAAAGVTVEDSWLPPSFLSFNLHLAVRRDDPGFSDAVDRALGELLEEGVVGEIAGRWGLTRAPFDEVFDPRTFAAVASRR